MCIEKRQISHKEEDCKIKVFINPIKRSVFFGNVICNFLLFSLKDDIEDILYLSIVIIDNGSKKLAKEILEGVGKVSKSAKSLGVSID